jgi:protein-S-isoprenylcysteine O-methyltransferase
LGLVAISGAAVGAVGAACATALALGHADWTTGSAQCALYMCCLCYFHLSEFLLTARFAPEAVSWDSFLLNHSREYGLAVAAAALEFALEAALGLKAALPMPTLALVGGAGVLAGLGLRAAAMVSAASNFRHVVETRHRPAHVLVTSGVYRLWRHPSYTGFFVWSVASQVLLGNVVCAVAYVVVLGRFFRARIAHEEALLLSGHFFGPRYLAWAKRTWVCIPGVGRTPVDGLEGAGDD